jgi:hypothetical protein
MKNCSLDNDIVHYLFELDEFQYYIYTSNVFSRGVNLINIINEFCFIRGLSFTKLWCSWPCDNIPKRKGSTHMVILEASIYMTQLNINISLLFNSIFPTKFLDWVISACNEQKICALPMIQRIHGFDKVQYCSYFGYAS